MIARFLARKYLSPDGRLPFLTVVAIAAVAIAVCVQILVLSVMRGFRADLMGKFIGLHPHLRLVVGGDIPPLDFQIIPTVEGEGILTADGGVETGVRIRGVTEEALARMPSLQWASPSPPASLPAGWQPYPPPEADWREGEGAVPSVAIGAELAGQIGATPPPKADWREGGRVVTLIAPFGRVSPSGDLMPQRLKVQIAGIFRSGLYEVDQSLVLMDPASARQLLGPQASVAGWGYVAEPMQVAAVAQTLRDQHPDWKISTWQEENAALFGALKLERIVMTTLLILVVAIAATGITGVLFLLVLSRQQEMGVLLALGATSREIRKIFMRHGAQIGIIGAGIGIALALLGCAIISSGQVPLPESLYLHTLPISVSVPGILLIGLAAIVLTTLAAWYPTRNLHQAAILKWLREE